MSCGAALHTITLCLLVRDSSALRLSTHTKTCVPRPALGYGKERREGKGREGRGRVEGRMKGASRIGVWEGRVRKGREGRGGAGGRIKGSDSMGDGKTRRAGREKG